MHYLALMQPHHRCRHTEHNLVFGTVDDFLTIACKVKACNNGHKRAVAREQSKTILCMSTRCVEASQIQEVVLQTHRRCSHCRFLTHSYPLRTLLPLISRLPCLLCDPQVRSLIAYVNIFPYDTISYLSGPKLCRKLSCDA